MNKLLLILVIVVPFFSYKNNTISYFNQAPPSTTPKLFAPSIVNTDSIELNVVFNYDNTEMFFSRIVNNSFYYSSF